MKKIFIIGLCLLSLTVGLIVGAWVTIKTAKVYNHPIIEDAHEIEVFNHYFIYE